jgi:tetratricopeptide (TPR) repeat protein
MKKAIPWALLAAALFLAVSCASTPPEKPKEPEPPQVTVEPQKPAVPAPEAELAKAKELKQRADRYSLGEYAPVEYAAAVKDLEAGEAAYGKDNAASKQSLDRAIDGFTTVISKGGGLLVDKIQVQSTASKKAADDIKAPVAVKDEYAKALEVYNRAIKEKAAGNLEQAGSDFAQAQDMFDAVYAQARDKREKALQAMKETEQLQAESEQKAQEAETSLTDEGFSTEGGR